MGMDLLEGGLDFLLQSKQVVENWPKGHGGETTGGDTIMGAFCLLMRPPLLCTPHKGEVNGLIAAGTCSVLVFGRLFQGVSPSGMPGPLPEFIPCQCGLCRNDPFSHN